jgi:bifunctional enzyme CysN/CysC
MDVTRDQRAKLKNQKPAVIWMTGLSGSGKSSIANAVEKKLLQMKRHTFILDGDNVRLGLNKDLGFTNTDRVENIRRVGQVAKLMTDAGLIVIVAFISPFQSERDMVRQMMDSNMFFEVFIDTPLSVAEERDVKGLYAKARSGQIKNFTGIDSPYEIPKNPDIHIKTIDLTVDESAEQILKNIIS